MVCFYEIYCLNGNITQLLVEEKWKQDGTFEVAFTWYLSYKY